MKRVILGNNSEKFGISPAVILIKPKYAHNVGAVQRACSCYGVPQCWWTGNRVKMEVEKGKRLPREERMKGFADVQMIAYDRPFDQFKRGVTPIAFEVRENSELLPDFVWPENPVLVFGPEDGSIPKHLLSLCHRFVKIPTAHCLNLAVAVGTALYDRMLKTGQRFDVGEIERRGWQEPDSLKVDGVTS